MKPAVFIKHAVYSPRPLVKAMEEIGRYEDFLARRIFEELSHIPGLRIIGPDFNEKRRTPTISFVIEGIHPQTVCEKLDKNGILAWNGHFYGIRPVEVLGLLEQGGLTRIGVSVYNTAEEVDRLIEAITEIARK